LVEFKLEKILKSRRDDTILGVQENYIILADTDDLKMTILQQQDSQVQEFLPEVFPVR